MKTLNYFSCFLTVGAIVSLSYTVEAASISWGNALGSLSYNSDGSQLEQGTNTDPILFELGIFVDGSSEFTPTFENRDMWDDNFVALSSAPVAYDPGGSNPGYVADGVTFGTGLDQIDNATAPIGYQIYIWGYNAKTIPLVGEVEWLLITGDNATTTIADNNWIVPDVSDLSQENLALTWDVFNSNTAVVGATSESMGGGEISSIQTLNLDDVQFASIPEPSSSMLFLLGMTSLCFKRKR